MDQLYRDYLEGTFVPDVTVERLPSNGHFKASAMGLEVTHHDQAEAVNRLMEKLQDGITRGEVFPGSH